MNKEEFGEFVTLIFEESDRASVIVGSSYIDDTLLEILKAKLPNLNSDCFDFNGPLGTFSSRIIMAYGLGVYSVEIKSQIDILRRIRNSCAHDKVVNFTSNSTTSRIDDMAKPFATQSSWLNLVSEAEEQYGKSNYDTKLRLLMALILGRLTFILNDVKAIDDTSASKSILPTNV
ncbi:hypothetical protein AB4259_09790 [Vibrio amylolyticus]|uniref:hypothetical protein n=1 Tax=Vibrio amylolyticus TaxID=2847292 RepID=UPI003553732F